jgi:bifunctional UDP-N-acetylglucosamine pyrophosphorylase/glucosamine-1-phosphate N-acetyltransferase
MTLEVIILAAGQGTRMRSSMAKVLHTVGGKPMLQHVIEAANSLEPSKIHVVIGHDGEQVQSVIEQAIDGAAERAAASYQQRDSHKPGHKLGEKIAWVTQQQQLGTGHAVMQAMPAVDLDATVLLLYGDTPLISTQTLKSLIATENQLRILTATMENPFGLGRIVRNDQGNVIRIVEQKDASASEARIRECNTGFMAGPASLIARGLTRLDSDNAQQEFYLTDLIGHSVAAGFDIAACQPGTVEETLGINSQADLARAERIFQMNQAQRLLEQGVCLRDPTRFDIRGNGEFGRDCVLDINIILEGDVVIGDSCHIGANTIIRNSRVGNHCRIEANCVIDNAIIGERCKIGPFARLRPEAELDSDVHVGNFVEIKKSRIGQGSKANHLSYVGDSTVGKGVNIGAGVITCNYDGAGKHQTVIGDNVFVGSNSQLVAPVTIGDGATIGAGSTITQDVAAAVLAVSRARQRSIDGWVRPVRKRTE